MRRAKPLGCGCWGIGLLALIATLLLGGILFLANKYVIVGSKEALAPVPTATPRQAQVVISAATPTPEPSATPTPVPTPQVDLADLEGRMQEWPDTVTLARPATFPGDVVVPAGTDVKVISAGREVEVEYQDQQAKLPADQTDLVARVLDHRAQVAQQQASERKRAEERAAREKKDEAAVQSAAERVYGRMPSKEDAYFAVKTYLKQTGKQGETLEIISMSQPVTADFQGRNCWSVKIQFRVRDEIGAPVLESGTAWLGGDQVLGYQRAD